MDFKINTFNLIKIVIRRIKAKYANLTLGTLSFSFLFLFFFFSLPFALFLLDTNLILDKELLEEFKERASQYKYACKQLEIFIIQIIDHQNKISGPEFPREQPTVSYIDVSNTQQTPNKDTNTQSFMNHLNMQRAHQAATGIVPIPSPSTRTSPFSNTSTTSTSPTTTTTTLRTSTSDLRRGSADSPLTSSTNPLMRKSSRDPGVKRSTSESATLVTTGSARQNPSLTHSFERGYIFLFFSLFFCTNF